jgi:replicative DNA helicase
MNETALMSRNLDLELSALCRTMASRSINPGLIPEYFCGRERKLFDALWDQWQRFGELDLEPIRKEHDSCIHDALSRDGTSSKAAVEELREHWMRRELARAVLECGSNKQPEDMARALQERISGIIAGNRDKKYIHNEAVSSLSKIVHESSISDRVIAGTPLGLQELDTHFGGIEQSKFYLLAALKKTGKSHFMIFAAMKMAEAGKGVLIDSLEMNDNQLNTLAASYYSGVNSRLFGSMMQLTDANKVAMAWDKVRSLNWKIYRERTVAQLKSRIIYERHSGPVDIVFVDYVQRMKALGFKNDRANEVDEISQQLADMSRELNIGVFALSQLSGLAEHLKKDEMPNMGHVKNSQGLSENADTIMIMHNKDRHKSPVNEKGEYTPPTFRFLVEQRYGFSGVECDIHGDLRTTNFWQEDF